LGSNITPQTDLGFKKPYPCGDRFDDAVWWFEFVPVLAFSADGRDICAFSIEVSINLSLIQPLITAWGLDDAIEIKYVIRNLKRLLQKVERWQEFLQEVERLEFSETLKVPRARFGGSH